MVNTLNLINTVSQIIMAISAIIAIIIAIKQIRYSGRTKLKGYYKCGVGAIKNETTNQIEKVVGINIKIINLGLAPVYIEYCGIEFIGEIKNKDYPGLMTASDIIKINPGESSNNPIFCVDILLDDIDNKVSLHDKVYVYAKLCDGKILRWKTTDDYSSFKHEYMKVTKLK